MSRSDLVVLVADKDIESAIQGVLNRPQRLRIRQITHKFEVDPEHDPGCFRRAHDLLRSQVRQFSHALVVFDHHGSGQDTLPRETVEQLVADRLARAGWDERAAVVVVAPEIEQWVWSDSPHVGQILGDPNVRAWLAAEGHWPDGLIKPPDPKGAMESVLRRAKRPRSPSNFKRIAEAVSFERCTDPAFQRLCAVLRQWFPIETSTG